MSVPQSVHVTNSALTTILSAVLCRQAYFWYVVPRFGFMPGKGTTDAIFIMRKVEEKHQAKKQLYYAFADLEKKFPREVLRWVLRKMGVDELALYPEVCTVVQTYAGLSECGFASRVSCCMLMSCYLWHQQWNSLVDMRLKGELAFLTTD